MASEADGVNNDLAILLLSGSSSPTLMAALDDLASAHPALRIALERYRDPDDDIDGRILLGQVVVALSASPSKHAVLLSTVATEVRRLRATGLVVLAKWVLVVRPFSERASSDAGLSRIARDHSGIREFVRSRFWDLKSWLAANDGVALVDLLVDDEETYGAVRDAVMVSFPIWYDGARWDRSESVDILDSFADSDEGLRESLRAFLADPVDVRLFDRLVLSLGTILGQPDAAPGVLPAYHLPTGSLREFEEYDEALGRVPAAGYDPDGGYDPDAGRRPDGGDSPIVPDRLEPTPRARPGDGPDRRPRPAGGPPVGLSPVGPPPSGPSGDRPVAGVLEAHLGASAVAGTPVTFTVEIASQVSADSLPGGRFATNFPRGARRLPLRLELASNDFEIDQPVQPIVLRPDGTSERPVGFTITPVHAGEGSIVVGLFRESTWLATAKYATTIAERPEDAALDPVLERKASMGQVRTPLRPSGNPDLTVVFILDAGRFQCTLSGTRRPRTAYLPIEPKDLTGAVAGVRLALESLATDEKYQSGIDIGEVDKLAALKELRSAGSELLRTLFFTREAQNPRSAALGREFIKALRGATPESRVVFLIEGYSLPWHALYLQTDFDGDPSQDLFLGLRHVISEFVDGVEPPTDSDELQHRGALSVALHLDTRIDRQQGIPITRHQLEFWKQASKQSGAISLYESTTSEDAIEYSLGPTSEHHVLYFVCHAGVELDDRGEPLPALTWLGLPSKMDPGYRLTHRTLNERNGTKAILKSGPLVFINACESAQLSPEFYKNFATYFLERGARTLIGTECRIATFFADKFASELFRAVLSGWTVGDAILQTRLAMLKRGNALGLAYGLHGSADTRVVPNLLGKAGV